MRLIDADAIQYDQLLRIGNKEHPLEWAVSRPLINSMPTIEAEPIKHGHWIDCKGSNGKDYRKCSECLHTQDITGLLNYCPVCGTKMDEVEE